jgi:hypothetical protein
LTNIEADMTPFRTTLAAFISVTALAANPAFAALSPFYDSGEKIDTILKSNEVADALRQAPIRSVENTGTRKDGADEWLVRTQECDLKVWLVAVPPKGVGMTTYRVDGISSCK